MNPRKSLSPLHVASSDRNAARSASPDALRGIIRDHGLRGTAPRIAVLQQLMGAAAPLSHAEIADHLVPQGFDRATIYRNLIDLTDAGLVSRSDLGDHVWRFEIKDNDTHEHSMHPHFMCNACGRVSCLENIAITPSVQADQNIGEVSEILFKGRCRTCAQA